MIGGCDKKIEKSSRYLVATAYECESEWKNEAGKLEEGPLDDISIELDEYSA